MPEPSAPSRAVTAAQVWPPYQPSSAQPWNLRRVVHLHRRAGFAATWSELQRDLAEGPKASIDRLLSGRAYRDGVPTDFESTSALLAESATAARDPNRLKAWWLYRMFFGPDPLGERLALLWHNHFATSNLKVEDLTLMLGQNALFRELAKAPFGKLLNRVVRDPALLIWLDASANRKEHPNENLARELMELFTLGIGHYSERDVKEAARALTGWTLSEEGIFRDVSARHDAGEKTVLGQTGHWKGDDLIKRLLEHPATAERLAWRLCQMFMGEGVAGGDEIKTLAVGLRQHDLDIGWAVETVLRSQAFFAGRNLGNHIPGPVEFVVGAARALELFDSPPSTLLMADWSARLGQDLFCPPNVGGWAGGRSWITTQAMIGRANYAAALLNGTLCRSPEPCAVLGLAERHGHSGSLERCLRFYGDLLLGTELSPGLRQRINSALAGESRDLAAAVQAAVTLILASPEYQLA
ncbi:MAG TPA: DUF1800 domain-containing protein [Gemmataceae bacterium]|nr:DUF1800 domain-containing protein [Gemmataceae bacterium]